MPITGQLRPMLRLAIPLVTAEIGWMLMGVVDTVMVGHLPDAAIPMSAAALAQILFNTLAFATGGILLGLDTTLSQAHGAGEIAAANRWLLHGIALAAALGLLLTAIFLGAGHAMHLLHTSPEILAQAIPALAALAVGILPLFLYFTLRRYLQAFNHGRAIAFALVSANLINVLFNWLLIYSHHTVLRLGSSSIALGWHGFGVVGSGVATSLARVWMALVLVLALAWYNRANRYGLERTPRSLSRAALVQLLRLGVPAGATILIEILIFAVVTFLISSFGPVPLAGHEIALNCISFTFMIPMGLSAAGSVRVGQAIGRRDFAAARAAGWTTLALATIVMVLASVVYLLVPHALARLFTPDPAIIAAAVPLFAVAAIFQICDGLQVAAIGALRGAGDTHSGLITHTCTYWLVGLPVGIYLGLHRHWGAIGLWTGLSVALVLAGAVLVYRWYRVSRGFVQPRQLHSTSERFEGKRSELLSPIQSTPDGTGPAIANNRASGFLPKNPSR